MAALPSSSDTERARRIPIDLAWIAVAVHVALFVASLTARLVPLTSDSEQLRHLYTLPGVWIPMLCRSAVAWLLAAALTWSHARQALDERGTAGLAGLPHPGSRFAAIYLAVMAVDIFLMTPLFYQLQLLFMPGGALEDLFGMYRMRSRMAVAMAIQSLIQLAVLVLAVWFSAWFALRGIRRARPAPAGRVAGGNADASPRRAIAFLAAAVFVSLQVWSGAIASGWFDTTGETGTPMLLLGWFAMPLLVFALAFWGGWLGAVAVPSSGNGRARPFRAIAAAVLAFVLLQLLCIAIALGWLLWIASAYDLHGGSSLTTHIVVLAAIYLVLLVVLMRATTRWLYRRSPAAGLPPG